MRGSLLYLANEKNRRHRAVAVLYPIPNEEGKQTIIDRVTDSMKKCPICIRYNRKKVAR